MAIVDSTQNMNLLNDPVFTTANDLHVVGLAASNAGDNSLELRMILMVTCALL